MNTIEKTTKLSSFAKPTSEEESDISLTFARSLRIGMNNLTPIDVLSSWQMLSSQDMTNSTPELLFDVGNFDYTPIKKLGLAWRSDMQVRFVITSQLQHAYCFSIAKMPYPRGSPLVKMDNDLLIVAHELTTDCPFTQIITSLDTRDFTIDLPWPAPYEAVIQGMNVPRWFIRICNISLIFAANAPQNVNFTMWARLTNLKYDIYNDSIQ